MATTSALLTNNAISTLASGITNVATSMTVAAGQGALFPNPGASEYFYVTLADPSGSPVEIVKVTARATDVFTIVRGQDGTSGLAFDAADLVELRPIAELFREKLDARPKISEHTAAGNYTMLAADDHILINKGTGAATTVNLITAVGRTRAVKIVDLKGDAATNNITIDGAGVETVVSLTTYLIRNNYGSVTLWPKPDGSGWYI